jgi:hypothetical protein
MSNVTKKKVRIQERIAELEDKLRMGLQKKAAGPATDVPGLTRQIQEAKAQLAALS